MYRLSLRSAPLPHENCCAGHRASKLDACAFRWPRTLQGHSASSAGEDEKTVLWMKGRRLTPCSEWSDQNHPQDFIEKCRRKYTFHYGRHAVTPRLTHRSTREKSERLKRIDEAYNRCLENVRL